MNINKLILAVKIALVLLTVLFILLKQLWVGFAYISVAMFGACVAVFLVSYILEYISQIKSVDDDFEMFLKEQYNIGKIEKQQLEEKDKTLKNEFIKQTRQDRLKTLGIIILLVGLLIAICTSLVYIRF